MLIAARKSALYFLPPTLKKNTFDDDIGLTLSYVLGISTPASHAVIVPERRLMLDF